MTDDSALQHVNTNNNNNNNNNEQTSLREASRFDGSDEVSVSSNRSTQSTLSHRLKLASQRGEERARHHHAASSSSSVSGDKRRKKKSSKNKAVDMSAVVRNKARQFETTTSLSGGDDDASSAKSPSKPSAVDISLMEHEQDKKEKKKKKSKSSDNDNRSKSSKSSSKSSKKSKDRSGSNWDSGSLGSQLNPNKYTDAGYLSKTADGKFQKGLYLLKKSKYQMARDKFRAALKARILLYEDISHRALVPGHEIIGHVELKLGDWDKAALHFNAAKEICEGHLKLLDEEGAGVDEMEDRDLLIRIVERVNEGLSTVEMRRRSGTEIPGEMNMSIVDSIVEDLTRYDQLNDMQSKGNRSRAGLEIESIAEGEEEEEGEGGGAIVDKLPTLDEKPKAGKGGMKMSEHRLRMTYISKSQVAEEQYNLRQYELALSSFNDARSALVSLSSSANYGDISDTYNRLRDEVNKAFLSERIADCHVQKFFRTVMYIDKQVDYDVVTNELIGIKKKIEECMEDIQGDGDRFEIQKSSTMNEDIDELLKTIIQSLARVYSKQGLWCTKLKQHEKAISFYDKALDALAELRTAKKDPLSVGTHLGMLKATVMMAETNTVLKNLDGSVTSRESTTGIDTKPIYDDATQKLAMIDDPKAVWIAIYMVQSHHFLGTEAFKTEPKVALDHYFSAYRLAVAAHRKQSSYNLEANLQSLKRIDGPSEDGMKRALTTCVKSVTVLQTAAGFGETEQSLLQSCDEFKTLECVHIAHALLATGNAALASTWINNATRDMTGVFDGAAKREAEIVSYMLSVLTKASPNHSDTNVVNPVALYEGGLPTFTDGYEDRHRVYIYWALEEVTQRLHIDALYTGDQAINILKGMEEPPDRKQFDEFLWLIDAQIAILVKENEMPQALEKLKLRIDLLSRWRGNEYHEMAHELMRMACFFSINGEHSDARVLLEQALKVMKGTEGGDVRREIDLVKVLATTYDALADDNQAIKFYNLVMDLRKNAQKETDDPYKYLQETCTLFNAIAYSYLMAGDNDAACGNIEESLKLQKDTKGVESNPELLTETLILYGNILAAQNSLSQAAFYYDSAISSNPNKSPLDQANLRAWYNKGVTQFRNGDIVGAGHSFGMILDAIEEDSSFVSPEVAHVLNAIGSIHFSNKMYDKAIEFYTESLSKSGKHDLQVGSLSNIATSYFMSKRYSKAEKYFNEALISADLAGKEFVETKALVMTKLAYVTLKRKLYLDAFGLYNDASKIYSEDSDEAVKCESYAEYCRVQLRNTKAENVPLKLRKGITPEKPTFEPTFVSVGTQNRGRYRDAVYTPNDKILSTMGVEPNEREKFPTVAIDRKEICDKMLGYLLKRNRYARNEYALEFQKKMIQQLGKNFENLKDIVDEECSCVTLAKSNRKESINTKVKTSQGDDKRRMMLQQVKTSKVPAPDAGMNLLSQKKGSASPFLTKKAEQKTKTDVSANRKLLMQKTAATKKFGKK